MVEGIPLPMIIFCVVFVDCCKIIHFPRDKLLKKCSRVSPGKMNLLFCTVCRGENELFWNIQNNSFPRDRLSKWYYCVFAGKTKSWVCRGENKLFYNFSKFRYQWSSFAGDSTRGPRGITFFKIVHWINFEFKFFKIVIFENLNFQKM